jgi:hypothetical protein
MVEQEPNNGTDQPQETVVESVYRKARKELTALKQSDPSAVTRAMEKLKGYVATHPEMKENKDLQLLLGYALIKLGPEAVDQAIQLSFTQKKLSEAYAGIIVQRAIDAKSQMALLQKKIESSLRELDRRKTVYFVRKSVRRVQDGEESKRPIAEMTIWVDETKQLVNMPLFPSQESFVKGQFSKMEEGHAYNMLLNTDGARFFLPKNPMVSEIKNYKFDQVQLVKYIVENFVQVQEPLDEFVANAVQYRPYYAVGRVNVVPGGGIDFIPDGSADPIRMPSYQGIKDGDDVLVLGSFYKPKDPNAKYGMIPICVLSLTNGNGNETKTQTKNDEPDPLA